MPAFCQISKDDVVACVRHMNEHHMAQDVYQVGNGLYHRADKDNSKAFDTAKKREFSHLIDMDTETLHTMSCKKVGERTVKASVVPKHEKDTGLKLCACVKRAMKK
jgi:DNA-binding transcriptional regulator GbsR (MarR family)